MPTATTVPVKMAQRRDTAANWTSANPTLLAGEIGIESDTNKIKLGNGSTAWTALGYTPWSQVSAYPFVNADIAAAAGIAYSKLATLTSGNIVLGSSANVATSTAVTGDVTISNTGVTAIATGVIVNADINASAAIVDTKLATIATAGKVSNSATTAASANTASAIVARDASGNFTAGTITAALTGAASSNVLKAGDTMTGALVVPLASASTPSLTFTGDLNTGIFSPGADQLAVATNGAQRLVVDASGRVGVGPINNSSTFSSSTNRASTTYGFAVDTYNGASFENTLVFSFNGSVQNVGNFQNFPFALLTNNTERLRITSAGFVGIGTSAPAHSLHVAGDLLAINRSYFTSTTAEDFGGLTAQLTVRRGADAAGSAIVGHHATLTSGRSILALFSNQGGTDTKQFEVLTQGNAYLRGSLGIGTTTPQKRLDVYDGSSNFWFRDNGVNSEIAVIAETGGLSALYFGDAADDIRGAIAYNSTDDSLQLRGYNNQERARIDSSGRLLVGTSSSVTTLFDTPKTQVFVGDQGAASFIRGSANEFGPNIHLAKSRNASSGSRTILQSGDELGAIWFVGDDGSTLNSVGARIRAEVDGTPGANDMPGRIVLSTTSDGASSPTERMRILSGGAICLNTTALVDPATGSNDGLSVNTDGFTGISGNGVSPLNIRRRTSDGAIVGFRRDTTLVGTISVTTTATAYNTSSDYRLKENVTAVTDGITRLQQLKPSRFNFIADPAKTVDGFLAHEAAEVVPECVTGEKDAVDGDGTPVYQGIDQSKIVPLVVAALQECIKKVEALESELALLKSKP